MSHISIHTEITVDNLMSDMSVWELEQVVDWLKENQPKMVIENATAQELLFHQQIDHIKENYSRLTIEQEEAIKQIYESL